MWYVIIGVFIILAIVINKKEKQRRREILNTESEAYSDEIQATRNAEETSDYDFITFQVTGVHIANRKSYILNYCEEYSYINFVKEPRNKVDPNAIKIMHENKLIGYVPAYMTSEIHELWDRQMPGIITSIDYDGSFLEVEVDFRYKIEVEQS